MSALPGLAAAFQDYVLRGTPGIASAIAPAPQASVERRLRIYYDAYRSRLLEALRTDYEALCAAAGAADFDALAGGYIEANPSRVRNVRWFGAGLPAYLAATPPWAEHPWLAELAGFEWSLGLAFDAADASPLAFDDLARLPFEAWGTAAFAMHPSTQVLALHSNAVAIRKAVDSGEPVPAISVAAAPLDWLVWRGEGLSRYRSLQQLEAKALRAALDGSSFVALCALVADQIGEESAAPTAAGFLRTWVDDGLIVGIAGDQAAAAA